MMLAVKSFLPILLVSGLSCFSQKIHVGDLSKNNLPAEITYNGTFKKAISWISKSGEKHIVLLSESGVYENADNTNADLSATHYTGKSNYTKVWEIKDFIRDCQVDVIADFLGNEIPVTDLNNNGEAEIWIIYKIACRGDVSPDEMKLIMYEGPKKFAMRGENQVIYPDKQKFGGMYVFDAAFFSAPVSFREFAKKIWSSNLIQKL